MSENEFGLDFVNARPTKPPVEAVQVTEENLEALAAWINSHVPVGYYGAPNQPAAQVDREINVVRFQTAHNHGSSFVAKVGDWITRNGWNGFHKFTNRGFHRTHLSVFEGEI